jgi:hypothetical protein
MSDYDPLRTRPNALLAGLEMNDKIITSMILLYDANTEDETCAKTFTKLTESTALDELTKFRKYAQSPDFYRLVSIAPYTSIN